MATPAEIRAYQRKLNNLATQADKLDNASVRQVMAILRDCRHRVASAIVSAEGFEMVHLDNIMGNVNRAFAEFTNKYNGIMLEGGLSSWEMGANLIDEPLKAAGMEMAASAMPVMGELDLAILQGFSADLISDLNANALAKINTTLQLGILGEKTPFQVMGDIGRNLTGPSVFGTIANRSEAIARTELGRIMNMATQKRLGLAADVVPMKKFWMGSGDTARMRPSHLRVWRQTDPNQGGKPISMKAKFKLDKPRGGKEYAKGPHDPALSAGNTINCMCRLGTVLQ